MTNAKQELWAKSIVALLKTKLVSAAICNQNVVVNTKTSKLHIVGAGEVEVFDVDEDKDITFAEPEDTDAEFTWNVDKGFGILVKDTDVNQTEIPWEAVYSDRGAYAAMKALDESTFTEYANAGIDSYESSTTPWQLGSAGADVPAFLASIHKQLDDVDAADEGRYIALPSIGIQACRLYMASKNSIWGDQVLSNGVVGNLMGFTVHKTSNLTTVGTTIHGLAGVAGDSIASKVQIDPSSIEQFRPAQRYATLIRGRVRAGHKVYRASTLVDVNLNTNLLA